MMDDADITEDDAFKTATADTIAMLVADVADTTPDPAATIVLEPTTGNPSGVDDRLAELPTQLVAPDGNLQLVAVLGEGGMGRVDLAHQRSLQREVAVKTVRSDVASPAMLAGLMNEAVISGQLEHPNIVPVYELCRSTDNTPVIVMRRVEGHPWLQAMHDDHHPAWEGREGDLLERNIRILMDVCHAIEYAHSREIVHRDLKPENVLIGRFGAVYVIDWGLARRIGDVQDKSINGTPAYMAPEQAVADVNAIGAHTDQYLLGATLHELLTGEPRHARDTLKDTLVTAAESAPATYGPGVPQELAEICNRACAKFPSTRFDSVAAFRLRLAEFLQHRVSNAVAAAAEERLAELKELLQQRRRGDTVDLMTIAVLFRQCQFGFESALANWPDNDRAEQGRLESLTTVAELFVLNGDPKAARLTLTELSAPPEELLAALEALEAERSLEAQARQKLEATERDQRLTGEDNFRSMVALATGVFWCAMCWLAGFVVGWGPGDVSPEVDEVGPYLHLLGAFASLFAIGGISWVLRDRLAYNLLFKQFVTAVCFLPVASIMAKLAALNLNINFIEIVFLDWLIVFTAVGIAAAIMRFELWLSALQMGLLMSFAQLLPQWTLALAGVSFLLVGVQVAWLVRGVDPPVSSTSAE